MSTIKPVILLADSQLLFWRDEEGRPFLERARALIEEEGEPGREIRAAYLGASNGDRPEFYDLFVSAMEAVGVRRCRQIPSNPGPEDLDFLDEADLVLLAGGDVWLGWTTFEETGLKERITSRYYAGALLLGVSAGAVQLGLKGWDEEDDTLFDTFRIVPFVVDVHDEPSWHRLHRIVPKAGEHARGFGIPSGGGAFYHPDYSLEPVRHPLVEIALTEEGPRQSLLLPGEGEGDEGERPEPSPIVQELLREGAIESAPAGSGPDDDPVN